MKILITGIAGTLGRAFVEVLHKEHNLVGVDHNEANAARLLRDYPDIKVTTDDFDLFNFEQQGFDLVIHLAALKHIDLCERSPSACVKNNVVRTYELFKNAKRNGVEILFMSTDKAVEPISMYGYSKALMEGMAIELGGAYARSGNILASNGSVLDIWEQAIQEGSPVRVTDPKMRRYFISPENLADRVWNLYKKGVKRIVPEMDRDVLLIDLAAEKLAEHGYTIESYPPGVEYIGLRGVEKLEEKLQ